MGGSFVGAGSNGGGSYVYPATGPETVFVDLSLSVQTVADAMASPSDSPAVDTTRLVTDGTRRALWTYDASEGTWKGVEVS